MPEPMRGKCDWLQPIPDGGWRDLLKTLPQVAVTRSSSVHIVDRNFQAASPRTARENKTTKQTNNQGNREKLWTCAESGEGINRDAPCVKNAPSSLLRS